MPRRALPPATLAVYAVCMSRTNLDIDDQACAEVMRRYRFATKREAVNYALRTLAAEPASEDEARALRGQWLGGRPGRHALRPRPRDPGSTTSAWIEFLRNTGSTVCKPGR